MKTRTPWLFPKGRPHLIGISESLDIRVVDSVLSHAEIDPTKVVFIDAARNPNASRNVDKKLPPGTEAIVILNLAALVDYKIHSEKLSVKETRQLQELV
jgi:hypothetical protein